MSELKKTIFGAIMNWISERGARNLSYDDLRSRMTASGARIGARFRTVAPTPHNLEAITHIIGIERWAAHRVRVALGDPLVIDEYDDYRPAAGANQEHLCAAFDGTRAATLALVGELQKANVPITATIVHNELGAMSVGAWLVYMDNHAVREGTYRVR